MVAIVFAQTKVEAPKKGASSRAAPISLPRLAAPTTKTIVAMVPARTLRRRPLWQVDLPGRSDLRHRRV